MLLILLIPSKSISQDRKDKKKLGIGIEVGQWLPSTLYSDPNLNLEEVPKKPYLGILFLKPLRRDLLFRSSVGFWKYDEEVNSSETKSVRIIPIVVDLKYMLLTEVFVQPFVSYGAGMFFGSECKGKKEIFNPNAESEMGIGISLGTGFDFQLSKKFAIELEFRYLYVKFNHAVVFADNYSGPKVNLAILLLL
jgi:hypothetical protein